MRFLSDPAFLEPFDGGVDCFDCVILDSGMTGDPDSEWKICGIPPAAIRAAFARLFLLYPWQAGRLHVKLTRSIGHFPPGWSILAVTPGNRSRVCLSGAASDLPDLAGPAAARRLRIRVKDPAIPRDALLGALIHWLAPFHPAFPPAEVVFDEAWLSQSRRGAALAAQAICVRATSLSELEHTHRQAARSAIPRHASSSCNVLVAPPSVATHHALRALGRIGMLLSGTGTYALLRGRPAEGFHLSSITV